MNNYASLLATETILQAYITLGMQVDRSTNYFYEIKIRDKATIKQDANLLNPQALLEADRQQRFYSFIETLLCRPPLNNYSEDYRNGVYLLERWVSSYIQNEKLKDNTLYFNFGHGNYNLHINEECAPHNHCSLSLVKAITEGHKFVEERGSHFLVTTPLGDVYGTTTTKCGCTDFLDYGLCDHILSVKSIIANRKLCREHKVFKSV